MPNIEHLFNKTVNTYRLTTSVDSGGSPIMTFALNLSSLKCRVQQKESFEPVEGGMKFSKTSYVLYCASDADVIKSDVILYSGDTYNVVSSMIEANDDVYLFVKLEKTQADID